MTLVLSLVPAHAVPAPVRQQPSGSPVGAPPPHGNWRPADRSLPPISVPGPGAVATPAGPMAEPNRVGELVERRTPTERVYQLADGRVQAEVSARSVNYRDAAGRYQPIDTRVGPTGHGLGNKRNTFRSYFGDRPGSLARIETDGFHVGVGMSGGKPVVPKATGSTVTYPGVLPGADVSYQVTPAELKERIILAAPPSGDASYAFTLDLGDLRAHAEPNGSIALYRADGEGAPVARVPKPFMTDSAADPASPYGTAWSPKVTQTLGRTGNTTTITVRADQSWLADPHRKYPVVIDPTIKIQPALSQDAMIVSDDPASNFDGNWRLSVGTTTLGQARSLVRFGLGTIPAGTQLDSAQLQLYFDQDFTSSSFDVPIEAHRVTAPWDESTVTWNSTSANLGELSTNTETVDDTDTAKIAVRGSWPNSTNSAFTQFAVNQTYRFNKDTTAGDSFTWVPRVAEAGTYQVDAHFIPAADRSTVPYTVNYSGGNRAVSVNQSAGTGGVWTSLGSYPFAAGTTGSVVLGDVADGTKASIADAVRLTKSGVDIKKANQLNVWHSFSVRDTVQSWLNGTQPNYGFMLKAADETTLGHGGPRYEAAEFTYNGETENTPKLILTYGRPSVQLDAPNKITATGAELHWSTYTDPNPSNPNDDIVEYQVHRSVFQTFTPTASTLVAPIAAGATTFTDTTANPTPAADAQPFGNAYYYMIAVKTRDGSLIPTSTQLVRLPKAGRVVQLFQGDAVDTALSSSQPTANLDSVGGSPWLMAGNNSATYGNTRSVVKFPSLSAIPASATVLDASFQLWSVLTVGSGATYEMHALNQDFVKPRV